jgi:hypothetical protein
MAKELLLKYEKKMKTIRDELDLRRKIEIHEIEEVNEKKININMYRTVKKPPCYTSILKGAVLTVSHDISEEKHAH